MNRFHPLFLLLLLGCSSPGKKQEEAKRPIYYPYAARREVRFSAGSDSLAALVLNFWKGFESGDLVQKAGMFADTIHFILPDEEWKGPRENVLKAYKARRDRLKTAQCHIDFWKPVQSSQGNLVLLWAQVEGTLPSGKRDSYAVHQVWTFSPAGAVVCMQEYQSRFYW